MSGIAELLLNLGYRVSGSDLKESEITRRLASLGRDRQRRARGQRTWRPTWTWWSPPAPLKKNNPEVIAAKDRGIPVIPRRRCWPS